MQAFLCIIAAVIFVRLPSAHATVSEDLTESVTEPGLSYLALASWYAASPVNRECVSECALVCRVTEYVEQHSVVELFPMASERAALEAIVKEKQAAAAEAAQRAAAEAQAASAAAAAAQAAEAAAAAAALAEAPVIGPLGRCRIQ